MWTLPENDSNTLAVYSTVEGNTVDRSKRSPTITMASAPLVCATSTTCASTVSDLSRRARPHSGPRSVQVLSQLMPDTARMDFTRSNPRSTYRAVQLGPQGSAAALIMPEGQVVGRSSSHSLLPARDLYLASDQAVEMSGRRGIGDCANDHYRDEHVIVDSRMLVAGAVAALEVDVPESYTLHADADQFFLAIEALDASDFVAPIDPLLGVSARHCRAFASPGPGRLRPPVAEFSSCSYL